MYQEHIEVQKKLAEQVRVSYTLKFKSIRDFALEVGCDEKTIRNILNCEKDTSLKMFISIARALEIAPETLLKTITN